MEFQLTDSIVPRGDQPRAIEGIVQAFSQGDKHSVLLGVTGSGKTFTMANIIRQLGSPTLVIAPNKTLAAQLFTEFRQLFPDNAVGFFISYYDYYQPEAYIPGSDTYIAKDAMINDDIDKMRHAATQALFERRDVIIVASVSCIYGMGSPESYANLVVKIKTGEELSRNTFLRNLIEIQYSRNDTALGRGTFRVRGDVVDILPSNQKDQGIRVEFFGDEIESISLFDVLTGKKIRQFESLSIYPNSHYVTERDDMKSVVREILTDLGVRLREFKEQGKLVEYQRLEQRTMHDVELLEELGFCPGIENYSRYLTAAAPGEPPPTLLDYFPDNFLTIIDESHITVPQIGAMFRGDRARKETLVNFGFRLPAALDNRPLKFEEFLQRTDRILYVSATPGRFEME
ncbi:MAG: DEAD/DEAH box helicase family protein, partial [Oligoflexus sp.]